VPSLDFGDVIANCPREYGDLPTTHNRLLRNNPRHPSLHFKKIGRFWSVRVGLHYRAPAVEQGDDVVGFWAHTEYNRLLGLA